MWITPGLYNVMTRCALPLARLYLRKRARKQPAYLEHWDERFGWSTYPARGTRKRLWLHAVSVGETNAARPLIDACFKEFGDIELLLTCMTPTGRETGQKIAKAYPGRVTQCYLPYDTPELMEKFIAQTRPELAIIMETEVWPNMIFTARAHGIDVILANARESEKSQKSAQKFIGVMGKAFGGFSAILAQSESDARRIESLGGRQITVCGSVKFDIRPDPVQVQAARHFKQQLNRPVLLMASTRQGEEALLTEELKKLPSTVLSWLVPRHPQRFDEVAEILTAAGLRFVRKSEDPQLSTVTEATQVVLADTMGEMSFNCAMGDVCIMGGSLLNTGCQNLIDPAAAGVPVILGQSTFNFAKVAADAIACGAAQQVQDAQQAVALALNWLNDGRNEQRKQKAREFASSYTGATEKMMNIIRTYWRD